MRFMQDPDPLYQSILHYLHRLRRHLVGVELASGLLLALSVGLALLLVGVGLEALFYLPPPWRVALGLGFVAGPGLVLLIYLRRRLPALLSIERLGLHLEARCPRLQQRLISTLELWQDPRARRLYSLDLLKATVAGTAALLVQLDRKQVVDLRGVKAHARGLGLVALLVLGSHALFGAALEDALYRCAHPLTPFVRQARTHIALAPGDFEVVKGEDALVEIRFEGVRPRTARILRREAESASWQHEELVVDRVDSLVYTFKQVKRPFSYQVSANDGYSRIHHVSVVDPPSVRRLRLRYHYPAYSGLEVRVEEESGDISGLTGTVVDFEVSASKSLRRAALVLNDSLAHSARVEGHRAYVRLKIETPGHYHFELVDQKGIANRDPIRYAIQVVEDTSPQVAITDPGRDMDLPENLQLVLAAEAVDDFGIERAFLVYRINDGPEQGLGLHLEPGRQVHLTHLWDLASADLLPEDRVYYHVEAFDNDEVSGPKGGKSQEYTLRFPSLYELYEEVAAEQEAQLDVLEELAEEGQKNQEYLDQLRRELLKTNQLSWEEKKELEATLTREAERARAVEELAQQLGETLEELDENRLAPREILDKLEEIRELMAEVTSPELRQALEAMQQAAETLDSAQVAEALKQFKEDQEVFQKRLDRTLELLQQVRAEQRLEAAVQQALDLEHRQIRIDAELEQQGGSERLQAQEGSLQRDADRLREDLKELSQDMEQFSEETSQSLAAQADLMQEQNLSGRMGEMIKRLQQQQNQEARRLGASLEKDLGALSASLERLQDEYAAKEKKQLAQEMQQAIRDLLHLSLQQEDLKTRVQDAQGSKEAALAQDQFALLQGVGQVTEHIGQVARRTMSLDYGLGVTLGYALRNMQEAAHHLGQKNALSSMALQEDAMGYLNEAVLLLRQSMDNLAQSKMPSSFGETMQQMLGLSERQADLNQATQQAMGKGRQPGRQGRPVHDMAAEMARLAAQQRQIYQALRALERDARGHRGAQKRIQAIEEEMKSVIQDLQRRRPNPSILRSQKRILQRMLDASRSIHTQGFEEERLAEGGRDLPYSGQAWLPADLGQSYDHLREAMKHALEGPYPDEYRLLIHRYYEGVYQDLIERESKTRP